MSVTKIKNPFSEEDWREVRKIIFIYFRLKVETLDLFKDEDFKVFYKLVNDIDKKNFETELPHLFKRKMRFIIRQHATISGIAAGEGDPMYNWLQEKPPIKPNDWRDLSKRQIKKIARKHLAKNYVNDHIKTDHIAELDLLN